MLIQYYNQFDEFVHVTLFTLTDPFMNRGLRPSRMGWGAHPASPRQTADPIMGQPFHFRYSCWQ